MQNPMQLLRQFDEFRQKFNGDPKAEVEKLLASGQMTQAQFNQIQKQATELQRLFGIK